MKYNKTNISDAVIRRLPMYYRHLVKLLDNQTLRVSSKQLADIMNVTASQIRQDLNHFGSFGQQGYGYDVVQLKEEIVAILGIHEKRKMIIIGAGNIGQALAKFAFETFNFEIVAIFDQNKELIGKSIAALTIKDISELENYLEENQIDIAALTISNENVEPFSDRL
ncbi:MAG: redox-sensing transcriptional repressor Rex, partial [Defluviitaleaceae bacterium]|nr:redox-sensing transcriptional repressor Rex [Defluviitaleaceae bacterium]